MNDATPQHKRKYKWEAISHRKAKPIQLLLPKTSKQKKHTRVKSYEIFFKTTMHDKPIYHRIDVWTKNIRNTMRKIASDSKTESDLLKLNGKYVDNIEL
jgi:hypothetical protein